MQASAESYVEILHIPSDNHNRGNDFQYIATFLYWTRECKRDRCESSGEIGRRGIHEKYKSFYKIRA